MRDICKKCNLCCKLLGVQEIRKPAVTWCPHCDIGQSGCTIYHGRPPSCRTYECVYYTCKERGDPIPEELRPDLCHVIIDASLDGSEHYVRVDPQRNSKAWENQKILLLILPLFDIGAVWLVSGNTRRLMRKAGDAIITLDKRETIEP